MSRQRLVLRLVPPDKLKILITEPSGSASSIGSERKNRCRLLLKDEATEPVVISRSMVKQTLRIGLEVS